MKIYGRNAVEEAIKSGTTIDRLIVEKGLKDVGANRIIAAAKSRGVRVDFRDKEALDRELPQKTDKHGKQTLKHQGFVAEITDFRYADYEDIASAENQFIIIVDGVEDPHNLGSILRVAECVGASGVIIPERRSVTVNDTVVRVSAGAANHVKVAKVVNINSVIDNLKERGVFVYACEVDGDNIYTTNLSGAVAIVVGGEGKGVHTLTKKKCDGIITIPMRGQLNSLNASVALGVAAFEVLRQRG